MISHSVGFLSQYAQQVCRPAYSQISFGLTSVVATLINPEPSSRTTTTG